ncbi:MAG: peptidase and chymotrypsin/Hap [Planctomycetaceae bacterium]|nr:peptidase and chymotrypsin/Hap [Planctomycetaceae bacterium]
MRQLTGLYQLGTWNRLVLCLLVLGLFEIGGQSLCGSEKPDPANPDSAPATLPKTTPQPEKPAEKTSDKTVEQLAESVRQSVVVISVSGRDGKQQGIGAGFVISPAGLIATNAHVIGEGRPISIQFHDGKQFPVTEVHATQRMADLAILRIDRKGLVALELGDATALKQGQAVVAMGNPHGLKHSIVSGVVSGTREIDGRSMIQLAMPIEPGNSGGPLLDMQGRVQGIITMKSLVTNNLGFAVLVNALKPLLDKPNPVAMERWLTIGTLDPKEWTQLFGSRWRQRSGHIFVDGLGQGFGGRSLCLSEQPIPEIPFECQVQVKLGDEAGAAGLVFHSDGADRHYGFYASGGKLRLSCFEGPDVFSWRVMQEKPSPAYRKNDWNLLKVRIEKDRMLCSVNDQQVFESSDTQLARGKVGLAKFRETTAEFKGFQVGKELPRLTPDPTQVEIVEKLIAEIPTTGSFAPKLLDELTPHAPTSLSVLRQRAKKLEQQAQQLRKLADMVHQKRVRAELVKHLQGKEEEIDLFRAALLVAWIDNDDLDIAATQQQLERMARQLIESVPKDATADARRDLLNKFLFVDHGFHGSRGDYYNKSNSYVNEVLDDREGLPITLSVVYLELARRIGLDVVGIGMPTHFVVEQRPPASPRQFIDVFEGGKALSRVEAADLVKKNTDLPLQDQQLEPVTKKMIVSRILENLLSLARNSEDSHSMLNYLETLVELDPTVARHRWLRAVFRFELSFLDEAMIDVDWLLQTAPEGVDFNRVKELGQFIEKRRREQAQP